MTTREAIRILMLSPIYFKLNPGNRRELIRDYCELYEQPPQYKRSPSRIPRQHYGSLI